MKTTILATVGTLRHEIQAISKRIARPKVAALACLVALASGAVLSGWLARNSHADAVQTDKEMNLALASSLSAVLAGENPPTDAAGVQQCTAAAFSILYPALATQEARKDPVFAATEDKAIARLLDPSIDQAEMMNNDESRRQHDEALRALGNFVNQPDTTLRLLTNGVRAQLQSPN